MQKGVSIGQNVIKHSLDEDVVELGDVQIACADLFNQAPIEEVEAHVYVLRLVLFDSEQIRVKFSRLSYGIEEISSLVGLVFLLQALNCIYRDVRE